MYRAKQAGRNRVLAAQQQLGAEKNAAGYAVMPP